MVFSSPTLTWCCGDALHDTTTTNIERGVLFPFNGSAAIYRCPADRSNVEMTDGTKLAMLRTRSYSMGLSMNGNPLTAGPIFWPPNFEKESEINDPVQFLGFLYQQRRTVHQQRRSWSNQPDAFRQQPVRHGG